VVAYQLAAAVGEDRWTAHPTCALLLVAAGREPPDETALWEHAAKDRGVTVAGGIRRVQRGANLDDGAGLAGEVSADAPGEKGPFRALRASRRRNRPPSGAAARTRYPNRLTPLQQAVVRPIRELEAESQNGNPGKDASDGRGS